MTVDPVLLQQVINGLSLGAMYALLVPNLLSSRRRPGSTGMQAPRSRVPGNNLPAEEWIPAFAGMTIECGVAAGLA